MKYVLAIFLIFIEFIIYLIIAAAVGWKYGGGFLVNILLFALYAATWRAVVKRKPTKKSSTYNNSAEIKE